MRIKEIICTMFNSKKISGLHITTNHKGKMQGMYSLSTSCICNKNCIEYSKDKNKICSDCYAFSLLRYRKNSEKCLEENTRILTESVIPMDKLPIINALYFRFEAFGDLNNEIQLINYFNICKKNKRVTFALFTKNPWIIEKVLKGGIKKPSNLIIVISSFYKNVVMDVSRYDFVDKVFTVYEKKFAKENNIEINCGAKACINCQLCYRKNNIKYISELKK